MDTKPMKVLLIEDNAGDARLIREMLSEAKSGRFEAKTLPRLSSGLDFLAKEPVDVVLLDLGLPDSQGIETFRNVKAEVPNLPVVILTGLGDETLGLSAVKEGAQDYLVKGEVNSDLLGRAINYAIQRKWAENTLTDYRNKLRQLTSQVSLAEERERRRIATDVHDRMSQTLALCTMRLSSVLKVVSSHELADSLGEIYHSLQELAEETRSLTFELSPPVLYDFGLEAALERLCEVTAERHKLKVTLEDDGRKKHVVKDMRVELYRMTRELLINAVKHSKARSVIVRVRRVGKEIQITVEDDGVGFDTRIIDGGGAGDGFGLFSIRERLSFLDGRIEAHSRKGEGSRIRLIAPLSL